MFFNRKRKIKKYNLSINKKKRIHKKFLKLAGIGKNGHDSQGDGGKVSPFHQAVGAKRRKGRKGTAMAMVSLFTLSMAGGVLFGTVHYLPESFHILQGEEEQFSFGLPLSASINNENISVLNINNKPVEGNIHVSLNEPFTVMAGEEGETKVSLSLFGMIPVKTVSVEVLPKMEVVPCGKTVGVELTTDGIMVLGTGDVWAEEGENIEPAKGILHSGDSILQANGAALTRKEDLISAVEASGGSDILMAIKTADGEKKTVSIKPVKSRDDGKYKIGVWVRDSTQGIGTITYYNPETRHFGALGHGVYDVDTKGLMEIKAGEISESMVTGVKKGEKGNPGELLGSIDRSSSLGVIKANTEYGLYGEIDGDMLSYFPQEPMEIGLKQAVREGPATILTNITGDEIKEYNVMIESVNRYSQNPDKGMVVRITDEVLLDETSGIVQGMSGSPIIQNGKLIGAVTHVFVQDPTKGYGIFIENMIKEESKMAS